MDRGYVVGHRHKVLAVLEARRLELSKQALVAVESLQNGQDVNEVLVQFQFLAALLQRAVKLVELVDQAQCPREEVPRWFLQCVLIREALQDVDRHRVHLGLRPVIRQEGTSRRAYFVQVLRVILMMIQLTQFCSSY